MSFSLGPWRLHSPLAQGGMGEVWRGEHAASGLPVAVKLLLSHVTRRPDWQDAFRREARAVAGLDDPRVVRVYDFGEANEEAAEASEGRVLAGAPFLVMELAEGTLAGAQLDGKRLYTTIRDVLGALAHAHARGLVHRDVKSANILQFANGRTKLADFGIARTRNDGGFGASGTPRTMAPEQIRGLLRAVGPWTDIYALGCVAWELATGAPPYLGTADEVRRGHLRGELPAFAPRIHVPRELGAVLRCWLARRPDFRPSSAADALAMWDALAPVMAMSTLSPSTLAWTAVSATETDGDRAQLTQTTHLPWQTMAGAPAFDDVVVEAVVEPVAAAPVLQAVIPPEAPLDLGESRRDLHGAGLGLYGLRSVPLVGRVHERRELWDALLRAARGTPQAVVLRGPSGCGKSRLAQWLAESASEVGCPVVHATHAPSAGAGDGLWPMVVRAAHAEGLNRDATFIQLGGSDLAKGLLDAWWPLGEPSSAIERQTRLLAWFQAFERPLVVWLDDVAWGADALGLLIRGLARPGLPVLFVATAREEALAERPLEREALDTLPTSVPQLHLGPLSPVEQRELVGRLLGLDDDLAVRLEARTGGNPLFAVHLVGDWVARGVLELGPRGFRAREGSVLPLPDDLHAVWTDRVARLVGYDAERLTAIRIAAALGLHVDLSEWRAATTAYGVNIAPGLLDELATARLGTPSVSALTFAHAMLRETILRDAPPGELQQLHAAIASVLTHASPERLGRHLLAAGKPKDAIPHLLAGANQWNRSGETRHADVLFRECEAIMADELDADDPRWAPTWFIHSAVLRRMGRWEESEVLVDRAFHLGVRLENLSIQCEAWARRLGLMAGTPRQAEAEGELEAALALIPHVAENVAVLTLQFAAQVHMAARRWDLAEELCRRATTYEAALAPGSEAWRFLGQVLLRKGRLDEAEQALQTFADLSHTVGNRPAIGNAINDLAAISHLRGDFARAAQEYKRAATLLHEIGADHDALHPTLNAVLAEALMGHPAHELASRIERLQGQVGHSHQGSLSIVAVLAVLAGHATLESAETILSTTNYLDSDIALLFERIATEQPELRERALALAIAQWNGVGEPDRAKALAAN